jgi:glycosyltransferase involved in cell wall biosynthesis
MTKHSSLTVLFATSIIRSKGDVDAFLVDLVKELARRAAHVYIICLQCDKLFISKNITVLVCPFRSPILRIFWLFSICLKISLIKRIDFYLCFISEIVCLTLSICAKLTGKKILYWYCSVYASSSYKVAIALKLASTVITCSDVVKKFYSTNYGINPDKIYNVGHGISVVKFYKANESYVSECNPTKPFTIVSVARISPVKEWEKLIFAIRLLREKKSNIKVLAVGSPPAFITSISYFNTIKELIVDSKLEDVWQFLGSIPNEHLIDVYREADVVVLPGYAYKTILESLAAGKITLFEKKSANLIFPPDVVRKIDILTFTDYLSLSQRLLVLLDNKKPFIEATNYLSNFVIREFSVEQYVSKILHLARKYK